MLLEGILLEALKSIENTIGSDGTRDGHVFMNFLPSVDHSIEGAVKFTQRKVTMVRELEALTPLRRSGRNR